VVTVLRVILGYQVSSATLQITVKQDNIDVHLLLLVLILDLRNIAVRYI